jgi:hypothetical protein
VCGGWRGTSTKSDHLITPSTQRILSKSAFHYYNEISEAGYFKKKRGLFWLMVLEEQGLIA